MEMDEVLDEGSAELKADGSLAITFAYYNGDNAVHTAVRDLSITSLVLAHHPNQVNPKSIGLVSGVLEVQYQMAWLLSHRISEAMRHGSLAPFSGDFFGSEGDSHWQ